MAKVRQLIVVVVALVAVTACNPLSFDPQVSYPGFEVGGVRVSGTDRMWIEGRVTGTDGYAIYAMALIDRDEFVGPAERSCAQGASTVACTQTSTDVRQPGQVVLDGGSPDRLMEVWPDEVVSVWLVCVDEVTQDLSCPDGLRLELRTVDDAGALVGDLATAG